MHVADGSPSADEVTGQWAQPGKRTVSGVACPEYVPGASVGHGAETAKWEVGGMAPGLMELPEQNRAWEQVWSLPR